MQQPGPSVPHRAVSITGDRSTLLYYGCFNILLMRFPRFINLYLLDEHLQHNAPPLPVPKRASSDTA